MTLRGPRVAIVKLSSLGDVVHALPVARALRRGLPGAHLTWVVEAREYAILRDHPDLDAVVPVDTRLWRRLIWRPTGAREVLGKIGRLRTRIRRAAFDVAIDLQGLIKSGLLTAYTGAPVRIGFSAARCRERMNALFTNRHVTPPASARHVVEQYLSLLEPLGITPGAPEFFVPVPATAARRERPHVASSDPGWAPWRGRGCWRRRLRMFSHSTRSTWTSTILKDSSAIALRVRGWDSPGNRQATSRRRVRN
jgi:ADP-heptose:LPS heptosyltransferase